MLAALCFVLHTKPASSIPAHPTVVQIVSTRAQHSSTPHAPRTKLAFVALPGDRAASPVPLSKVGSPISAATVAPSHQDRRKDEPDQSPV